MILAKSDGTTLQTHTRDLLVVAEHLEEAIPILPELVQNENFWELLKQAIILHDIGKMSHGFQKLMKSEGFSYRFRHEWLSAAFVPTLKLIPNEADLVALAVLAHHKLFEKLFEAYKQSEINKGAYSEGENPDIAKNPWFEHEFETIDSNEVRKFFELFGCSNEVKSKNPLPNLIKPWIKKPLPTMINDYDKRVNLFFSASLSICDHNASAGMKTIPLLKTTHFDFLSKITPFKHQTEAWELDGNVLLVTPTGSGKTESALGWLRKQLNSRQGRTFYILPFTASINAMVKRTIKDLNDEQAVGLLHGKARFFVDEYYEKEEGQTLKNLLETHKKIYRPLKIVTPFQVLKWAFGVKGFEKGLTELAGSYLIFDEIHIYDRELFERILFFIEWLIKNLSVKVFIMTATMPTFMLKMICDVLKTDKPIRADSNLLTALKRHRTEVLDGDILDQFDLINKWLKEGDCILVVCNTVKKAQEVYSLFDIDDKVLLHSSFNARDRALKEQKILSDQKPRLLVGTQAIEVSLDIDYDCIFTEAAPLDALLQRFGRVFRKRRIDENSRSNCFICNFVYDKAWKNIYDLENIAKSLSELEKVDRQILDEKKIQCMLDNVYLPFEINQTSKKAFLLMLDQIYPFRAYEDNEEKFNEQFDGVEVLPIQLYEEWKYHIDKQHYLNAEKLFVPVSKNRFAFMRANGLIINEKNVNKNILIVQLLYDDSIGLTNERYVGETFY